MGLVFVHGRGQERSGEKELLQKWLAALERGVKQAALTSSIDRDACCLPFFADHLVKSSAQTRSVSTRPRRLDDQRGHGATTSDDGTALADEFRNELAATIDPATTAAATPSTMRGSAGLDHTRSFYNRKWAHFVSRLLDDRCLPIAERTIDTLMDDVASYLNDAERRKRVDQLVSDAIEATPEPRIVVAHSLGSVVSFRVIHALARRKHSIARLITLGSPLGVKAVWRRMDLAHGANPSFPANVSTWINAADARDIVALRPLDRKTLFAKAYTTRKRGQRYDVHNIFDVDNPTENRHGIEGYLSDPVVARAILGS